MMETKDDCNEDKNKNKHNNQTVWWGRDREDKDDGGGNEQLTAMMTTIRMTTWGSAGDRQWKKAIVNVLDQIDDGFFYVIPPV